MDQHGNSGKLPWIRAALAQYEGPLLRYAHRLVGDLERARDIVQETFLRLCRQDPSELDGRLPEWLYTVCRNLAFDVLRKESRMVTTADGEFRVQQSRESAPADTAEQRDSVNQILNLLNDLPGNQQEVIRLKFQGSLSYQEISEITGLTVSYVGFLIHRGVKTLREQVRRSEGHLHSKLTAPEPRA